MEGLRLDLQKGILFVCRGHHLEMVLRLSAHGMGIDCALRWMGAPGDSKPRMCKAEKAGMQGRVVIRKLPPNNLKPSPS
jgi:hypothetical protein